MMRSLGFFIASLFAMLALTVPAQAAPVCGNSVVESGEDCDDGNTDSGDCCSPTCQYESAATVCRPAAGVCDAPDHCDGAGACTPDAKLTSECRASAGVCDPAQSCDGVSDDCPPPPCFPILCRASTGDCDPSEWCEARYLPCPPDIIFPAGAVCRADAGDCDVADFCDGVNSHCPIDAFEPEGTSCDDGNSHTHNDQCDGSGVCMGTPGAVPAMSPWGQLLVGLFVLASGAALLVQRRRDES